MTKTSAEQHAMEDGATEVVDGRPQRTPRPPLDIQQIAKSPAGGRNARLQAAGDAHRREFIVMRRAGAEPVRIALAHATVFKSLWHHWMIKRVNGADDPGVAISEIATHLGMAPTSVSAALRSLARNGAARSIDEHVGWRNRRTRYYPTREGADAFALAEYLGDNAFVQVGRTAKVWGSRSKDEPANLFQHAALIRGWSVEASTALEHE